MNRAPRPRRVAYLHDNVAFGGMETLQLNILEHLDPARYDAVVVVAEYQRQEAARFRECLDAIDVPLLTIADTRSVPIVSGLRRIWMLRRLLRQAGVDVAHIQTRTPEASRRLTVAAFLARTPALVRTEHVSPAPHVGRWTRHTVVPFDRVTDLIITDSKADRDEQIRLVGRAPEKVVTSYCGIDPFAFDEHHDIAAAKRALGIDPASIVIGTVGRLHEQKGHRYLVAAAAQVLRHRPATTLLLVGDGPDEAALRQQVADEGITERVTFAG
ncbi:MAG: glycosyltransferase, partial [Ilumatobacteraceae bacterium]